jgi:hypothetical protein
MSVCDRGMMNRLTSLIFGEKRDPHAPGVFHKLSLIALFAWVGLGADGLSSSCYGPSEGFLALAGRESFSLLVAVASMVTVFVISAGYMQVIEMFPAGGGGYLVASKLLSPKAGMVAGCALLIDYVLTITISVASGTDAIFSFLPPDWVRYRMIVAGGVTLGLIALNLRGVKESVLPLVPVFAAFIVTHVLMIVFAVVTRRGELAGVAASLGSDLREARAEVGVLGILLLLMRSYSMGAGTYTGIEAVSNGVPMLREPKVKTAHTTMRYMSVSLSLMVGGLMLAYLLYGVAAEPGKTLNAVVCERVVAGWPASLGRIFLAVTLISEATLLFVAAQTGFLGGPSVLATMANDRWVPARFALLSNRLVIRNGILLIGASAFVTLLVTHGSVHFLVVLYSINVFITFTLSQLGMTRHWLRAAVPTWLRVRRLLVSGSGFLLSVCILVLLVVLKFFAGGWITLGLTLALTAVVAFIRREYQATAEKLGRLDDLVEAVDLSLPETGAAPRPPPKAGDRTAVLLVNGYGGVGLHSLLAIFRLFGDLFQRYVFVQVGVIDAAAFKGVEEMDHLRSDCDSQVDRYVQLMRRHGYEAEGVVVTGLDVAARVSELAPELRQRYARAIFFGGQLVFRNDSVVSRLLHNYTIFDIQRLLYQQGIQFVLLPIRV